MDTVAASRRNHTSKKENKENTQPANETKSSIKRGFSRPPLKAPLQPKGKEKDGTSMKSGLLKASAKQTDGKLTSAAAVKDVTTLRKVEKGGPAPHSQAFTTTQASKHQKLSAEAPKPLTAVPSSKPAPGMYKGKIIQSKIGSIWKSNSSLNSEDPKPSAPKTTNQRVGNVTKSRITPAAGCGAQKPVPQRSKTVSAGANKPTSRPVTCRPPTGVSSARPPTGVSSARPPTGVSSARPPTGVTSAHPPTRTVPTAIRSRNATVGPTKRCGTLIAKPTIPATDRKASKPPVCSTLSQYRQSAETQEEKKAKLAEWLASKGKSLKRPAMVTRPPTKTKASARPEDQLKSQPEPDPEPAAQCDPEPEPSLDAHEPSSTSADERTENQEPEVPGKIPTPEIMNTTLDLLENSDVDLSVDPVGGVDDIVINLCEALEAMETPSCCDDEPPQVNSECDDVEVVDMTKDESEQKELKNEKPEDVEQLKVEKTEEETDEQKLEDSLEDVDIDGGVMASPVQDASVVKYSVKTTPYLQSVKKTIADEVGTSSSRRKSNISDVKFLTPVRRSSRIQRKSSRLPTMLVEHDPCVSSLAELVKLDDNPNAYIYRKNPALLEDLPDAPRV